MECILHVTFDCPTENLDPSTIADMVSNYMTRSLGVQVHTAELDLPELVVVAGPEWGHDGPPDDYDAWLASVRTTPEGALIISHNPTK